ncbi:unnamed protein product [Tetraodon nigroviridis]|uniref:(spotted green pufferfish) hypothetical protein n=1 Tax=Tetraodon nigroviridis TaxID=99883 RepID=Q4SBX0_TETNG|nr:unnamed protein product [Tetraodon nigroviridis]
MQHHHVKAAERSLPRMDDNSGPVLGSGTNLSQVAIRDSTSGIVPIRTEGRVVERGYQIFAIDSLSAGSQVIVNYTAHIRSHKIDLLDLPAFLTFSNASQNDVSMFGPLTANLTLRVNSTDRIYKDVMSLLLGDLPSRGHTSVQTQQRLLSVLDGQLLGMEGRLKEERGARMTALANRCNLESREEMEAEHHREAAEKAQAKLLCKQADQQELLHCSVLMEKLHKLKQSQLQDKLLVQHEEASAKVQRQIIEWRRVELHKIFSEELEESTRMGEMERKTAESLQHEYFDCQDYLEEVLDMILANQRYVLAERHAQRKFLVHSLHSLNGLISDTFSITSDSLDNWFSQIKRGSTLPAEQVDQLQDKAQKELVMVRQRLDETMSQEKRSMRCGLVKKRRELLSDMVKTGTPHTLLQIEHEAERPGQAQGVNSLQQGQEKLHQEGKTALHTLRCTRVALQETMEKELQEQRERRAHSRAFFSCLCSSQVSLCEEDRLKMKLEFLKCLSVMDRCLVLPHAVSKKKLHTALVKEEMQREREDDLRSGVDSVAMQMAALHYQKAERNTKVLETTRAALTLHGLLIQNLSERKNPDRQNMAQCIQNHCLALEEAEQRLQKKRTELEELLTSRAGPKSDPAADCDEREEERLFQVQRDCLMASIVQDALYKREQDLLFASQLVKQSQVSAEVLLEALRLLLPVLPESELLSITDALRSKQQQDPTLAEQEQSE